MLAEKSINIQSTPKASSSSSGEAFAKKSSKFFDILKVYCRFICAVFILVPKVVPTTAKVIQKMPLDKEGDSSDDDLGVTPLESSDSENDENTFKPKKKTPGGKKAPSSDDDMFEESDAESIPPDTSPDSPTSENASVPLNKV